MAVFSLPMKEAYCYGDPVVTPSSLIETGICVQTAIFELAPVAGHAAVIKSYASNLIVAGIFVPMAIFQPARSQSTTIEAISSLATAHNVLEAHDAMGRSG